MQSRPVPFAAIVAVSSLVSALAVGRLSETGSETTSFTAPPRAASSEQGRHLFAQSCAHCHGNDARGNGEDGDGPDLLGLRIGNVRIAAVIRKGIPGEMPSFAKKHSTPEIADLTAYLRSLR